MLWYSCISFYSILDFLYLTFICHRRVLRVIGEEALKESKIDEEPPMGTHTILGVNSKVGAVIVWTSEVEKNSKFNLLL